MRKLLPLLILLLTLPLSCSKNNGEEQDDGQQVSPTPSSKCIYGYVLDTDGKPFEGAVMSDGYEFAVTDAKGYYEFENYRFATYIQCSIPSEAVITTSGDYNLPQGHFQRLSSRTKRYDFTYRRRSSETKFRILAIGDPQVKNETQVQKYRETALSDIKSYVAENPSVPTYGISLGDNVSNVWDLFPTIAGILGEMSVPVFSAIGNHDHEFPTEGETASRQRYEAVFGPVNYSFNRGKVHIVVIDNVIHLGQTSSGYSEGFEDWQYEWLKNDLSYVSHDMGLLMIAHIPVTDTKILEMIAPFANPMVVAGHTHQIQNTRDVTVGGKKIQICTAGSTGAPWKGLILNDGCYKGYKIYDFDGTSVSREIYKSLQCPESFQMRMYHTNDFPSFKTSAGETVKFAEYGDNKIAVNLFNYKANDGWTVTLSENGVVRTSSFRCTQSYDVWVSKFLYEVKGLTDAVGQCTHMLYFTLEDKNAAVTVTATDKWGNTFTQDTFTAPSEVPDYSEDI